MARKRFKLYGRGVGGIFGTGNYFIAAYGTQEAAEKAVPGWFEKIELPMLWEVRLGMTGSGPIKTWKR
ncbi:hypothetical protein LCGC14_0833250 [marine sediment metagenome]|uniref:Uncharacterized protein n=1 Tax=marine sediment metagenome TaxID=412755 RepID=A0A0F9PFA7_9ZZZZ